MFDVYALDTGDAHMVYDVKERDGKTIFLIFDMVQSWLWVDAKKFSPIRYK